jgi:hypothetical protein
MNRLLAVLVGYGLVGGVVAGAACYLHGLLGEMAAAHRALQEGGELAAEYDRQADLASRGAITKQRTADEFAAGRLTLAEAAARFGELHRANPMFRADLWRLRWPGETDEERVCREVTFWATAAARDRGEDAAALGDRLAADLRRHRAEARRDTPGPEPLP